jgi:hypothetical protein
MWFLGVLLFVVADKGEWRGGREGSNAHPHGLTSQKNIFLLNFFFENFWLPSLKNTSWASYFSKELASITHVEALPWFQ